MKKVLLYVDEYLEEFVMTILLILMAVIMGIQVLSRYVWSAFISVSLCTKKFLAIKIDQFVRIFSNRGRAVIGLINYTIQFAFFVYLVPYAWRYLMTTIKSGQVSPACGIPMYYIQSAPLICFSLCVIRIAERWLLELHNLRCNDDLVKWPSRIHKESKGSVGK